VRITPWTRGAVTAALLAVVGVACGGSSGKGGAAGAGTGGGAGMGGGGVDGGGMAGAPTDGPPDLATDFGAPMAGDAAIHCPTAPTLPIAAAPASVLIDDFSGAGLLDGRSRVGAGFDVREQFDATANASFDPEPSIEPKCGAAAAGAAHFRGKAADTGATFSVIFSSPGDGGKPRDHFDASATKGLTFRVSLGDPRASKLVTIQVNLAGTNKFDYTKDVILAAGLAWQQVTIKWTDLTAAPAAPAFSPATLNQIVIPFAAGDDVDLYLDDLAFVP
jgi:hypothetical protein